MERETRTPIIWSADDLLNQSDLLAHHCFEQAVFIAEVAVEDRPGNAGAFRDLLETRGLVSELGEHPAGHLHELLAPLFPGHALAAPADGLLAVFFLAFS